MAIKRVYISLIIVVLFLGFAACSSNSNKNIVKDYENIDFSKVPSMQGEGVSTLVTDSGKLTYRMKAPKLAIYDQVDTPYWDMPDGIHLTTFSVKGEPEGDIKSKFALYHINKDLWELRDDVVAINLDGNSVETDLLFWDRKKKEIYTDAYVKITEEGMVTTGYGFKTDEEFEDWTLERFTAEIDIED